MKIIFLDIDGVVNCATTAQRHRGAIGIDPVMAFRIGRIVLATGAEIVLSSTWRLWENSREEVRKQVYPFIDTTPRLLRSLKTGALIDADDYDGKGGHTSAERGYEIKAWLEAHPDVTRYAILDDDSDMLEGQLGSFFKTEWSTGITDEIESRVIAHLKSATIDPSRPRD